MATTTSSSTRRQTPGMRGAEGDRESAPPPRLRRHRRRRARAAAGSSDRSRRSAPARGPIRRTPGRLRRRPSTRRRCRSPPRCRPCCRPCRRPNVARAVASDGLAGQRRLQRLGVGDDLAQPQRLVEELAPGQARALSTRVLRRQDVADGEQDLARQLAVAARGAQAFERRLDRLRDQLADVAHTSAVGIQRVAQRRQHQHCQEQAVGGRNGSPGRRSVQRPQVGPEAARSTASESWPLPAQTVSAAGCTVRVLSAPLGASPSVSAPACAPLGAHVGLGGGAVRAR